MKKCERCPREAKPKSRFCKECEKDIRNEMRDKKYLQKGYGPHGNRRTQEMKEDTRMTKFGRDG